jgi:hypothetical protein
MKEDPAAIRTILGALAESEGFVGLAPPPMPALNASQAVGDLGLSTRHPTPRSPGSARSRPGAVPSNCSRAACPAGNPLDTGKSP